MSKWNNSSLPINIKYDENFSSDEVQALNNGLNSWESSTSNQLDFFNLNGVTSHQDKSLAGYDDNIIAVYKMTSWPQGLPSTALAVTQVFGETRTDSSGRSYVQIDHADILVNFDYFSFVTDQSWGYDLESILLHEIGHFLGLKHITETSASTVMKTTISKYDIARTPSSLDITTLSDLYYLEDASRSVASKGERVSYSIELHADGDEVIKINGKKIHLDCH